MQEVVNSCEQVAGHGLALYHYGIEKGRYKLNKRIKTWKDVVDKFKYLSVRCTLHTTTIKCTVKIFTFKFIYSKSELLWFHVKCTSAVED